MGALDIVVSFLANPLAATTNGAAIWGKDDILRAHD